MNKKRLIIIMLLFLFLVLSFVNTLFLYQFSSDFKVFSLITGMTPLETSGSVSIKILSDLSFEIINPENDSMHHFNLSQRISLEGIPEYIINLSIAEDISREVEWYYSLYNESNSLYYNQVSFSPNTTIAARSGWNLLIVEVFDLNEKFHNESVWFYVNISKSAPTINLEENQILYGCENSLFNYHFNFTDYDDIYNTFEISISPSNPFFTRYLGRLETNIFSGLIYSRYSLSQNSDKSLTKTENHNLNLSVFDGIYSDSRKIIIEILKINNVPLITEIPNSQIWTHGDNRNFYFDFNATDLEDGSLSGFTLNYQNGSSFNLFNISDNGLMNYTASNESPRGIQNLIVCVNDSAILNPHENLSVHCENNGGINTVCDNFTLYITDDNREPIIIDAILNYQNQDYDLETFSIININAEEDLFFNVTAYDGDEGFLDFNWTLNGVSIRESEYIFDGSYYYNDQLSYSFHCSVSGQYNITINASDGLSFGSHTWILNVHQVSCGETPPSSSGGGGGGTASFCFENWFCSDYVECLNLDKSYALGLIPTKEYHSLFDQCRQKGLNELTCGFNLINCVDLNSCNNTPYRINPPKIKWETCHYVIEPSCFDGIKNCHSKSCEVGIDCGGPCAPCPSCFDGIKNQREEGIDCGGPCPLPCEIEEPSRVVPYLSLIYTIIAIILIILIIYALYKIFRLFLILLKKRRDEDESPNNSSKLFGQSSRKKKIKSLLNKSRGGVNND
jgi:hypothetical protein